MCYYRQFTNREAYGLTLFQSSMGGPWQFNCEKCSLSPEKPTTNWHIKAEHDWGYPIEGKTGRDYWMICYTDMENLYNRLKEHIKTHIKAGHYVHPSTLEIITLNALLDYEINIERPMMKEQIRNLNSKG